MRLENRRRGQEEGETSADAFSVHRNEESLLDDGHELATSQVFEYLSNVMYSKRSKFDPFWNAVLVAGVEDGVPYVSFPPTSLAFLLRALSCGSSESFSRS